MKRKHLDLTALLREILHNPGRYLAMIAILGLVLGVLGIVLGAVGMVKSKKAGESKALAIVGLILGILGTILTFVIMIMGCVGCGLYAGLLSQLS